MSIGRSDGGESSIVECRFVSPGGTDFKEFGVWVFLVEENDSMEGVFSQVELDDEE